MTLHDEEGGRIIARQPIFVNVFLFPDAACRDPGCPSPSDLFAVLLDAGEQLLRKVGDKDGLVGIGMGT
jgi:hypothetical protein